MTKIRVLLAFGGESTEHEVSIASARNVCAALDTAKYNVDLCYITRTGHWRLVRDIAQLDAEHVTLVPELGTGTFLADGQRIAPDVLLPILHGGSGEDGSFQGLARIMHIPVVGCGVLSSAICMDKEIAKRLLRAARIGVTDYVTHYTHEPAPDYAELTAELGNTLFVKPAGQGSSVGVHKVRSEQEFTAALTAAHRLDRKVLIEAAATGREIECSVLGNDHPEASQPGEIKPGDDFYSYDDKYAEGSRAEIVVTADLPRDVAESVRQTAIAAYRALECCGLARVDFFVSNDGGVLVNEVNTLPGFTNISMYPKMWQAAGVSYPDLINKLISLALERDAN